VFGLLASTEDMLKMLVKARTNIKETTVKRHFKIGEQNYEKAQAVDESKPRDQIVGSSSYCAFEMHTTGFGSRMMAKIGAEEGRISGSSDPASNREILVKLLQKIKRQADQSENSNKEAKEKLEVALRKLEKAKAAEALVSDQIHKRTKDSGSSMNANKVKITAQEYEALRRKGDEVGKVADTKVATAMSQVETIKKKERQTIIKLEKSMEETKVIEVELADALKIAEMAEAAKQAIENELRKRCSRSCLAFQELYHGRCKIWNKVAILPWVKEKQVDDGIDQKNGVMKKKMIYKYDRSYGIVVDVYYSVAFDPLDGSSIVDTNFTVGTIFDVWPGDNLTGVTGGDQVAAALGIYGFKQLMLLLSRVFLESTSFFFLAKIIVKEKNAGGYSSDWTCLQPCDGHVLLA
ncbi:WEB family protein-like protein, partial [Tanacetum coccineum]